MCEKQSRCEYPLTESNGPVFGPLNGYLTGPVNGPLNSLVLGPVAEQEKRPAIFDESFLQT